MNNSNENIIIAFFTGLNLNYPLKSNFGFFNILPELTSRGFEVDVFIGSNDWNFLTKQIEISSSKFLHDFSFSNEPGVLLWKNIKIYHYLRAFLKDKSRNYSFSILQLENHESSRFVKEASRYWPGVVLLYDSEYEKADINYSSILNDNLKSLSTSKDEKKNLTDYQERGWDMDVFQNFSPQNLSSKKFNFFNEDCFLALFSSDDVRALNNSKLKPRCCKLSYPFSFLNENDIFYQKNFFLKKMNISSDYKLVGLELDCSFIYSDYLKIFIEKLLSIASCNKVKIVILNVKEGSAESDIINQLVLNNGGSLEDLIYIRNSGSIDYFEDMEFFKRQFAVSSLSVLYSLNINVSNNLSLDQILGIERLVPQVVTSSSLINDISFCLNLNLNDSFANELDGSLNKILNGGEDLRVRKDLNKNFIFESSNQAIFFNQFESLMSNASISKNLLKTKNNVDEEYHFLKKYS